MYLEYDQFARFHGHLTHRRNQGKKIYIADSKRQTQKMFATSTRALLARKASTYNTPLRAFMDFVSIDVAPHDLRATDPEPAPTKLFRLEFELFGKQAPLCTENFARLCSGDLLLPRAEATESVHEPSFRDQFLPALHYQSSSLHRVVRDYIVQGGDVTENFVPPHADSRVRPTAAQTMFYPDGSVRTVAANRHLDGATTVSAFGSDFDAGAELGRVKFDRTGLLGTAVSAPHKNHSQFFVLTAADGAPHLDGTCVCFGRVTKGLDELRRWQSAVRVDFEGRPLTRVQVAKCGML